MQLYQVTAPLVTLHAGRVQLTKDQARRRRHVMKHVTEDVFEITTPIQFKHGETFGYDGEVSKALSVQLRDPNAPKPAAAAADGDAGPAPADTAQRRRKKADDADGG